jgi:hypothetical protein
VIAIAKKYFQHKVNVNVNVNINKITVRVARPLPSINKGQRLKFC